jgi:hypothetical protein
MQGGASMPMTFQPISYDELDGKQKEAYNLQKVSAILADIGFVTIRMTSDWGGADFIAQHLNGVFLKVQLKSRLTFSKNISAKTKNYTFASEIGMRIDGICIRMTKCCSRTSTRGT